MTAKAKTASETTTFVGSFAYTTLDSELTEKAVRAVLKYHEKSREESSDKPSLLGDDRPVHVQFTLLRAPDQSKPKPVQIIIPHPFFKLADRTNENDEVEEPEICLIVKESSKPWCQEMIEKFPEHMGCVKKVLGLDSLRKKHTSYEQKRQLLHKYNMFMADDRILPMLSKALGKAFIQTKRLPVPISLTREKALPFAIQKALSATYMTVNTGTCISIRAGHTGMEPKKLVENIFAIAKEAVPKMPRKWANIQMIGIKTADSVSLPIYNKTPETLREIAKLAGIKEDVGVPSNAETQNGEDDSTDMKNKKKRSPKSPLLEALKKQKKEGHEEKKSKKQKPEDRTNDKEEELSSRKQKSKRKSSESFVDEPSETKSGKPNKNSEASDALKANEDDESPKKKQRKEEKKSKKGSNEQNEEQKKEFISAKKFKGSKKGYVFRMGRQGLGYYVDIKPVVDRAAMEAILRIGKNKSRRGGQKKNKYKGTRRF